MSLATVEIHEVVEGDDIREIVRDAIGRGCDPIIAAGGDGTVSTVADVLVGSESHLVVFPLGTANVLARELAIPIELEAACRLGAAHLHEEVVAGRAHEVDRIDVMKIGGRHYLTQVGVGIDSLMIRDTATSTSDASAGSLTSATAATGLLGFRPRRFTITVDDRTFQVKATQVLVANTGMMGHNAFRWGSDIHPDDGRLDVCIVRARTILDYLGIFWHVVSRTHHKSEHVRYEVASKLVVIDAKHPLPVQADGEILDSTPRPDRAGPPGPEGRRPFGGLTGPRSPLGPLRQVLGPGPILRRQADGQWRGILDRTGITAPFERRVVQSSEV